MTTDEMIETMARALAKADGLDWDEKCGLEAGVDECDSGTCIAAYYEDHDPGWARGVALRRARAALAAILPVLREDIVDTVIQADTNNPVRAIRARFDHIAKEIEG